MLLYEATWEKYVPSIGYDLDGDGQKEGAGTAKPEGYRPPSVPLSGNCRVHHNGFKGER